MWFKGITLSVVGRLEVFSLMMYFAYKQHPKFEIKMSIGDMGWYRVIEYTERLSYSIYLNQIIILLRTADSKYWHDPVYSKTENVH